MSTRPIGPKAMQEPGKARQGGVVTLVISLMILMLSTFVVFNVSKAILMEQKISNNDARAKQAFEAAEAGMNVAISYLNNNADVDNNGCIDPFFDSNADGITDTFTASIGSGSVRVNFQDDNVFTACVAPSAALGIFSRGWSDDRTATRLISQSVIKVNPLPNRPQNPLVVRGAVTVNGSATVTNPEGFSTIWSGDDVQLGSGAATETFVPDLTDPGYPACMNTAMTCVMVSTSLNLGLGVDVIENDSSLGDLTSNEFFVNFFGMSPTTYRDSMVTMDITDADDADLALNQVIWIQGNGSTPVDIGNITVGCTVAVNGGATCATANTRPSIVIVNGNVSFTGTPQFYGILYVTGNANMSGNTTVYGSAVIAGDASSTTGGSLDIIYNGSILDQTILAGASTGGAGTWRDF